MTLPTFLMGWLHYSLSLFTYRALPPPSCLLFFGLYGSGGADGSRVPCGTLLDGCFLCNTCHYPSVNPALACCKTAPLPCYPSR